MSTNKQGNWHMYSDGEREFRLGSVIGYRSFVIPHKTYESSISLEPALQSIFFPYTWQPGLNESFHAGRVVSGTALADESKCVGYISNDCQCGFYAFFDLSAEGALYHSPYYVEGVVQGYGKTLMGSKGFRSQFMRVLALCPPITIGAADVPYQRGSNSQHDKVVDMLPSIAERYNVPLFDTREAMLSEYPISDPYEVLGIERPPAPT